MNLHLQLKKLQTQRSSLQTEVNQLISSIISSPDTALELKQIIEEKEQKIFLLSQEIEEILRNLETGLKY